MDRFCRRTELLTACLGKSGLARCGLPFPFVLPGLKARFASVAAFGSEMAQKPDDDAPGNGSAERIVERHPEPREIGNAFGSRRFGHAAGGIPAGEIADPFRKTAEINRV